MNLGLSRAGLARSTIACGVAFLACAGHGDPNAAKNPPRGSGTVGEEADSFLEPDRSAARARPLGLPCDAARRPAPLTLGGYEGLACTDEAGERDGPFIVWYPDGTTAITGSFSAGVRHGPWRRLFPNGKTAEAGDYVRGKMHGRWRRYAVGGGLLGDFSMNEGTGVERAWYADGQLAVERSLRDGVLDGDTTVWSGDGVEIYRARFSAGELDGVRRFGVDRGLRLEDEWRAGRPTKTRRIWRRSTLELEVSFDDQGLRHGVLSAWRDRQHLREQGAYEHGLRHGPWRWYGRDHNLEREGKFVAGERHGLWRQWSSGRLILQGRYVHGRPEGTFRAWSDDGKPLGKSRFKNGTGTMSTFHDGGAVASRMALVRGLREGSYQERSATGRVLVQGEHADDLREGPWVERDGEGRLVREARYVGGKLDGVVRRYVRGQLASEITYVAGVRQGPYREWRRGSDGKAIPTVVGELEDDRRHGDWAFRNARGDELTARYHRGQLDGPWRVRTQRGEVLGAYREGRRAGTWQWRAANGEVERTFSYDP